MGNTTPNKSLLSQMELPIRREFEPDRNHAKGGRSFYFFDFDDNVAFLSTNIFLYEKKTGQEMAVPTGEFAQWGRHIGNRGPYHNFEVRYEEGGSFRRFRDYHPDQLHEYVTKHQPFIEDLASALGRQDFQWKGPSWHCFYHAAFNQRPVSLITARGHSPETMRTGIRLFVDKGYLPKEPNYLGVYPVSHLGTRVELGDDELKQSIASLKQAAIRASVGRAFELYGDNPHHRFGMSDDDPHNLELIGEEMIRLKNDFPENSFFIIETNGSRYVKREVFVDHIESEPLDKENQLPLF